jgi:FKBP-type peptidyl-prolyl cis-trans isomerase
MKTMLLAAIFSLGAAAPLFADGTNLFGDDRSKASYAIGMMFGRNLQQQGVDLDAEMVLRGLKDGQSGGATLLTPQEAQNAAVEFQQKTRSELAMKNKMEGTSFFAANKNAPGVVTLPDGLQYKVLANGSGANPAPESTVTVNYRGTFLDGREFDSSARTGHPVQLQASRLIHGLSEALARMKVGSKWQLFIPSDLAYGEKGRSGVPPNAALVFEVELLAAQGTPAPVRAVPPATPLTSDIIKVQGTNIETLKPGDLQQLQSQSRTN